MNFSHQHKTVVGTMVPVLVPDVTTSIPSLGHGFTYPPTLHDLLQHSSGSVAGHSAVSSFLACPEQSRLRNLGIRKKVSDWAAGNLELSARDYGILVHFLRALRILHGAFVMEQALVTFQNEMDPDQWLKTKLLFRTYDSVAPLPAETFDYIGVELEVITDIGVAGVSCRRSARYDTIIRDRATKAIFSFEAKTMARSGQGQLAAYSPQAYVQVALWNSNPALVTQFGKMEGVIFDCLVKTEVPKVERVGPNYVSKLHQRLALEYLRLPDGGVTFQPGVDGAYPRFLHSCWGKYSPCDYVGLCHEDLQGSYEYRDGTSL